MTKSFLNFLCLAILLILTDLGLISISRNNLVSQPVQAQEIQSGGLPEPTNTPKEQTVIEQRAGLRRLVPVQADGFTIDYDYQRLKFVVTFSEPINDSQFKFQSWMESHGFTAINPSTIEFK